MRLRAQCAISAVVVAACFAAWVVGSYMESRAFNRATGKQTTTLDAMFTDLRVTGEAR